MRRIVNLMLVLMLAAGVLVTPALAVGEDYTFTLTVNGARSADVMVGDTVTVALHVKDNRADSIQLYGMQDYINFDPEYLEFVPGTESYFEMNGRPAFKGSALRGGEVLINRASLNPLSVPNGSVLMQFKLRALKAGNLDVFSSGEEMIDQDASLFTVALEDAAVSVRVPHTHTMQHVAEKPATEQEEGRKEHWICTGCHKLFWDEKGSREAAETDLLLPRLQHVHTLVHDPGKPATETLLGLKEHWKCSGCGKLFLDAEGRQETTQAELELAKLPHVHALELVAEQPATVNSTGVKAHWKCSGCGRLFLDREGTREVTKEELIIPVLPPVPVTPAETENPAAFSDVPESAWYAPAVRWAVEKHITSGTGPDSFSPGTVCTRAQVVTFLWNAAGQPAPRTAENPFTDVGERDWYYRAVLWAAESGITAGTGDGRFCPGDVVTRGQTVTLLHNYCGRPAPGSGRSFADVQEGDYFRPAVQWAAEHSITAGTGGGRFSPHDSCTRAEIVTFLWKAF